MLPLCAMMGGEEEQMHRTLPWSTMLEAGAFSTVQAARLTGRRPSEIATWLRGTNPVFLPDYEPVNGRTVLSFEGLIEARVIGYFNDHDVPLKTLRSVMVRLRDKERVRHPLARDLKFVTDGFRAIEVADGKLINLANDVYAPPELLRPALAGRVVFEGGRTAMLYPEPERSPLIVIDPKIAFGRPVVLENGKAVSTSALAASVEVEGLEEAADWFGVSPDAARQALDYEKRANG